MNLFIVYLFEKLNMMQETVIDSKIVDSKIHYRNVSCVDLVISVETYCMTILRNYYYYFFFEKINMKFLKISVK